MKLNTGTGSRSPGCSVQLAEKSMLRPSMRGGVPVFRRPWGSFNSFRRDDSDAGPDRLPARRRGSSGPRGSAVEERAGGQHHGAGAEADADLRDAPHTRSPSTIRSSTACWNISRLGWFSRLADRGLVQHAVGLRAGGRTAGPLEPFRMRNWMPPSSVANAIAPPSASTSFTNGPCRCRRSRGCSSSAPTSRCCG